MFVPLRLLFLVLLLPFANASGNDRIRNGEPVPEHRKTKIPVPAFSFSRDPVVESDSASCVIPFSRAGNLIVIRARVDSIEGNFILDTGAPGLILNMTYFRHYAAAAEASDNNGGITGSVASASPTDIDKFSFGPIKYFHVEADRINLGHIENSKGIKILGLIGVQLLKRFEMIIDYETSQLHFHLIAKKEASTYKSHMLQDTSTYRTVPIDLMENKLITYGYMAGKKLTFIIDTGAESNVLDSRLPDKIFQHVTINRRVLLAGSGNKKIEALHGDMANLRIGSQVLDTLPVLVTNMEKMCFAYDKCLDGMLGFDFLSMHRIGFNFVQRKMYIWK